MKGVTVTKQARVRLTAKEWQLYESPYSGPMNAAAAINHAIEYYFNQGLPRNVVEHEAFETMRSWSAAGALDTEPRAVLQQILDELFGAKP